MVSWSLPSFLVALFLFAASVSARPGFHFHPCKNAFIHHTFSSKETYKSSLFIENLSFYRVLRPVPAFVNQHLLRSDLSFESSLPQARANNIFVIIAGLLFGIGCAALASAILHLFRSLFCVCGEEENPKEIAYIVLVDTVSEKEEFEGN